MGRGVLLSLLLSLAGCSKLVEPDPGTTGSGWYYRCTFEDHGYACPEPWDTVRATKEKAEEDARAHADSYFSHKGWVKVLHTRDP